MGGWGEEEEKIILILGNSLGSRGERVIFFKYVIDVDIIYYC